MDDATRGEGHCQPIPTAPPQGLVHLVQADAKLGQLINVRHLVTSNGSPGHFAPKKGRV